MEERPSHADRRVSGERYADSESPRSRERMERSETEIERGLPLVQLQFQNVGLLHRGEGLRRQIPRRQRLRAAGGLPRELHRARTDVLSQERFLQPRSAIRDERIRLTPGRRPALPPPLIRVWIGWKVSVVQPLAIRIRDYARRRTALSDAPAAVQRIAFRQQLDYSGWSRRLARAAGRLRKHPARPRRAYQSVRDDSSAQSSPAQFQRRHRG